MKKKLLTIFLSIAVILTSTVTVFAEAQAINGTNTTWELTENNTILTIGGTGEMPDFDTIIDRPWNDYRTTITSVIVNAGVTYVSKGAFTSLINLVNVSLPNTLTSIGERAFQNCAALESITIPASVEDIGGVIFNKCTNLNTIVCKATKVPTFIYNDAFGTCAALTKIQVPAASVDTYKTTSGWMKYADIIEAIPLTIADILPDDFPITKEMGWTNGDSRLFIDEEDSKQKLMLFNETLIPGEKIGLCEINKTLDTQNVITIDDTQITFNIQESVLVSITLSGLGDEPLNGTYVPPTPAKTIAEILATNSNFPTSSVGAWIGPSNICVAYKSGTNLRIEQSLSPSIWISVNENVSQISDTQYKYHYDSTNNYDVLFNLDGNNKLVSIEFASVSDSYQLLNGIYAAPKTVADILAMSENQFPGNPEKGWVNSAGKKATSGFGNLLIGGNKVSLSNVVTKDTDGNYVCTNETVTFTFVIESNKLVKINVTGSDLDKNGTYEPYKFTTIPTSITVGSTSSVEFVTNGKYVDQSTTPVTVEIDGGLLDSEKYTVTDGSTHVKLKGSYVSTLGVGTHTIKIGMTGYSDITSEFTITAAPSPTPTTEPDSTPGYKIPKTGIN